MSGVSEEDRATVAALLGRAPQGAFEVVVRHGDGSPVVIANAPFLDDGTPMPTRWWLVGEPERSWVGWLESQGGVARAEQGVDPAMLAGAHARYAALRDALIDEDHQGPRPTGGVGGTRRGVKCLHAHYAWWLAGGDDPVGEWVAEQLAGAGRVPVLEERSSSKAVAAIDCGTNSTRLLIARRGRVGLTTLVRRMQITRLGQGVDATGLLDDAAIERTLEALRSYRNDLDDHGVTAVRATATSAARDASNRDAFFGPASQTLGVELELLTGDEEAALSFAGATADMTAMPGTYLIVDIGGGSTEFASGRIHADGTVEVRGGASIDIGCVRISERFLHSDPPEEAELDAARAYCGELIGGALDRVVGAREAETLVGLAGTVSTLASVDLGLAAYDHERLHHHVLDASRIERLCRELLAMRSSDRIAVRGMEAGRAEVIAGGLVILGSIMEQSRHGSMCVSESDILDGLAASLTEQHAAADDSP